MKAKSNLTGRAGRWSAEHPWRAIGIWLAFVVVAVVAGSSVGTAKLHDGDVTVGESARAMNTIAGSFPQHSSENVLIKGKSAVADDAGYRATLQAVVEAITATGQVSDVRSPLQPENRGQISPDGKAALVTFEVAGPADEASKRIKPVLDAVAAVAASHTSYEIMEAGEASLAKGIEDTAGKDFKNAERISVPLALLVLLLTFGALVAALLPVALALTAIVGASGLLAFASHLSGVDSSASSVMLLIGLAVGVDYCLFYVKREREERARGLSPHDALTVAAATSGRSVLISGVTVLVALCGMFLTGSKIFVGIAEATVLVVAAAVIGSLTVLPALLSLLGDRVEKGRIPFVGRARHPEGQSRVWGWVVDRTLARPVLALLLGSGVLLALAVPALSMRTATPGAADLPRSVPVVQAYHEVQRVFPGSGSPAIVAVSAKDVTAPSVQTGIRQLAAQALATGEVNKPVTVQVSRDAKVAIVTLPLAGDGENEASVHALATLREKVVPATIGAVSGAQADVTGQTAGNEDFKGLMRDRGPIVFGFVLVLAFVLLLLSFRSVVIAAKAIVLNLLSVFAAYGLLVAVFQWGWGERLLGFHSTGTITSWLPLFLFVVLFSLSMDYHVFILSRVREAFDRGAPTDEAVAEGIKSTAGVVTAAAIVMVMTFSVFATLTLLPMKQLGVGLASAVLLDATIVRGVLLPAAMKLLGERNWYLPRWLDWLPQISHGAPQAVTAAVPDQRSHEEGRILVGA
jgi:RND superfamily putative drug exporter